MKIRIFLSLIKLKKAERHTAKAQQKLMRAVRQGDKRDIEKAYHQTSITTMSLIWQRRELDYLLAYRNKTGK